MDVGFDFTPIVNNLALLTRPDVLGLVLLGNLIGLFFGVLPGVSGGQAFIVLLPLTFGWQPEVAIWFLMGMLGATSEEVMKARFSYALLSGQGYDTSFIDELLPQLANELRRKGR